MPDIEVCDLTDKAVLWRKTGDNSVGEPIIGAPEEIKVRWIRRISESLDPNATTVRIDVTAIVAVEIPIDSLMWYGALEDLVGTGSSPGDVYQVVNFTVVKDIKGRAVRRAAHLIYFSSSLPAVE